MSGADPSPSVVEGRLVGDASRRPVRSVAPLMLLGALLVAACATPTRPWTTPEGATALFDRYRGERWTGISLLSGMDFLTHEHLYNVLLSEGIPTSSVGSALSVLSAPRSLARRALEVLQAHEREDIYSCLMQPPFVEGGADILCIQWCRPGKGVVTEYGAPISEVLAGEPPGSLLAAALREKDIQEDLLRFPFLARVERWDRPFLAGDGSWRTGAYLEVHISSAPGAPEDRGGVLCPDLTVWFPSETPGEAGVVCQGGGGGGCGPGVESGDIPE